MTQPHTPTGRGPSLRPFYVGITLLYSADFLLVQTVRWGLAASAASPILLAATVALPVLPQLAAGLLGPEAVGGRRPLHATVLFGGLAVGAAAAVSFGAAGAWLATALLAAALLGGWAEALAVPQSQASLMQALAPHDRVRGSRNFEVASRLPSVLAPIAGGGLIAAAGVAPALLGAAFLLVAGGTFFRRRTSAAPERPAAPRGLALRRSLAVLRRDGWLRTALLVRGVSNLAWPAYMIALPLLVLHRLHGGAVIYGGLLCLYGVSTLAAAGLSGGLRREQLRHLYFASWIATGAGFLLIAASSTLLLVAAGVLLAGAGDPYVHMALDTHIGTEVAPADQAALFAFQRLVMSAMSIIGSLLAGVLLLQAGPAAAVGTAGAVLAASGLLGALAMLVRGRGCSVDAVQARR